MTIEPQPDAGCERVPLAALGFPIVFLTLLAHGIGIFAVRSGLWLPSPAVESAWSTAVVIGVLAGFAVSVVRTKEPSA